jgi:exosortase A-associated hydrolase 1
VNFEQRAICFPCGGANLYGIVSAPANNAARGVLIVVGGPQYRGGSHRQFMLLASDLAARGVPVMRFDYRGMGDSEGEPRTFEDVGDDIGSAIDRFFVEMPAMKELVIWGLCDAASAALFYAHRDARVRGLVLLNPWVRTDQGIAKAYLKHYYLARLSDRDLWKKILSGRFEYRAAAQSVASMCAKVLQMGRPKKNTGNTAAHHQVEAQSALPDRMLKGLERFKGNVLLIMSGNDLTAKEFLDVVSGSREWKKRLGATNVQRRDLAEANHTFAQRDWRKQVSNWTNEWIASW